MYTLTCHRNPKQNPDHVMESFNTMESKRLRGKKNKNKWQARLRIVQSFFSLTTDGKLHKGQK